MISLLTILAAIAYAVLKKKFDIDAIEYLKKKFVKKISEGD